MAAILGPGGVISRRLPAYESRPSQIEMAELVAHALESEQHAIVEGGTGIGKALDVDTPIATPTGWKRMGELCPGDMVFDESGTPTQVLRAFDTMYDRPCYEVSFSDGSVLVADEEHEWITHTWHHRQRASRRRLKGRRYKNFATSATLTYIQTLLDTTIATDLISMSQTKRLIGGHWHSVWRAGQTLTSVPGRGRERQYERSALLCAVLARLANDVEVRQPDALPFSRLTTRDMASTLTATVGGVARLNHAIPITHALKLPEAALPIDPFVLGVWLGDGSASRSQITTADPDLVREVEQAGYFARKLAHAYRYSIHLPSGPARSRWEPGIVGFLRELGVLNNKHIPLCYLRASERQRRALLGGLLDTDGTVSPSGAVQYSSTNPRLIRDVHALIISLGYRPSMTSRPARLYGKDCGTAYTITFTTADSVFRLPRKVAAHQERMRNYTPARNAFRYVTAIQPVASRPVRCIQVAAASHLYLAGEALIPTHNSLAYLIPAIYSGKKVIVSTANKALQDQLIAKDLPFLQHALPRDFSAALVKGRSNYLCLDRFDEEDRFQAMSGQSLDFRRLKAWAARTRAGDFEELEFATGRDLLSRVASTSRTCVGTACAYYFDACFVEKMRERAEKAAIVVCNHALLLADLVVRDMGAHLLPDRDAIIVDEAHRLEDTAISGFTVALARRDLHDLLDGAMLRRFIPEATLAVLPRLTDALFGPLESRPRFQDARLAGPLDAGLQLAEMLESMAETLRQKNPYKDLAPSKESRHFEKLIEWVAHLAEDVRIVSRANDEDSVRYLEHGSAARSGEITVKWTPVDVGRPLAELLFRPTPVICTSATLAVGDFSYFRGAVGIEEALELKAASPFDYGQQCLLYVPSHLPEFRGSATPEYSAALCDEIERLVTLSDGRAFLLFTSYRGLDEAYARLCERLPFTLLKQGEAPRTELLRRFRADGAGVLFGTKSFWEGVDVVGEALSLVVIDRMPFTVPDDPIVATRVERMKREGQDWFNDLMLPAAVLQLKQGFGRLIRSRSDRGVVAILDSRLVRKSYGYRVINALPPARLTRRLEDVAAFFQ